MLSSPRASDLDPRETAPPDTPHQASPVRRKSSQTHSRTRSHSPKSPSSSKGRRSRSRDKSAVPGSKEGQENTAAELALGFVPFLKSQKYVDAILKLQTAEGNMSTFPAHRVVLARRSKFFDELFSQPREPSLEPPSYNLPIMPEHPVLLEALGFVLWYLYTDEPLETSSMAIADGRWEVILGVYKISDLFRLDEPKQYYGRALRAAIDAEQEARASLDELHHIAIQAVKWDCVDISEQSTKRFMDLAGSALTDPKALSLLSPDSFERILENTDVSGRVELVGAFFKAKRNAGITVPLVSAESIWTLVTFDKSVSIQEIEELHNNLGQTHPAVLDAAANALMDDPSALSGCSMAFFLEVADRAKVVWRTTRPPRTPSPRLSQSYNHADSIPIRSMSLEVSRDNQGGWTPAETYTMVRGYIAIHRSKPWMSDEAKQKLWDKVPFMELPQAILQRADVEGIAPKKLVNNAFLKKIRSSLSSVFQSETPSLKSSPNRPTSMPPQTPPQRGNDLADQDSDESILSSPPQNETSQSDSVLFTISGRRSSLNPLSVPGGLARAQSDSGSTTSPPSLLAPQAIRPVPFKRTSDAILRSLSPGARGSIKAHTPPNPPPSDPVSSSPAYVSFVPPPTKRSSLLGNPPTPPNDVHGPAPPYLSPEAFVAAHGRPSPSPPLGQSNNRRSSILSQASHPNDSLMFPMEMGQPVNPHTNQTHSRTSSLSHHPLIGSQRPRLLQQSSSEDGTSTDSGTFVHMVRMPFLFPNGHTTVFELGFADPQHESVVDTLRRREEAQSVGGEYRAAFDGKLYTVTYIPKAMEKGTREAPGAPALQIMFVLATADLYHRAEKQFPRKGTVFSTRSLDAFASAFRGVSVKIAPLSGPSNRGKGSRMQVFVIQEAGRRSTEESRDRLFKVMLEIVERGDWGDAHLMQRPLSGSYYGSDGVTQQHGQHLHRNSSPVSQSHRSHR